MKNKQAKIELLTAVRHFVERLSESTAKLCDEIIDDLIVLESADDESNRASTD